jgi:hypothetical protein
MGNRGWDAMIYLCGKMRGDEWCETVSYTPTRLLNPSLDNLAEATLAEATLVEATLAEIYLAKTN